MIIRILFLIFLISGCLFQISVNAQKYLDLEYANRVKPYRYSLGESFTYQTKNDGVWYTANIKDLHHESGSLYLENTLIKLEDITQVRTYRNRGWSKAIGTSLLSFGAGWLGFSAVGYLSSPDDIDWNSALIISGSSALLGYGIQIPFRHETHKMGQKRRLRIVDLRF